MTPETSTPETSTPEVRFCDYQISPGTYLDPPEYCDAEAQPDSDYCKAHALVEDYY